MFEQLQYGDEEQYEVYELAVESWYTGTEEQWIKDVAFGNICNLIGHEWNYGEVVERDILFCRSEEERKAAYEAYLVGK